MRFIASQDNPEDFRSKLELAKEMIDDATTKNIPSSYVVVDSRYSSGDLVELLDEKKRKLIAQINSLTAIFCLGIQ